MGSVIQWGGFDSARVLTLPYFHIARCVVYSMQACKDGTLGSPQLVVRSLTTDSHSLGRHTGDGLAATLENILLAVVASAAVKLSAAFAFAHAALHPLAGTFIAARTGNPFVAVRGWRLVRPRGGSWRGSCRGPGRNRPAAGRFLRQEPGRNRTAAPLQYRT